MKLMEIIKPFVYSNETCDEVVKYFKNGNQPQGPYIDLAKYFIDENYDMHSETDRAYKIWLKEIIGSERENESIILTALKEKYCQKEYLEKFVFSLNNMYPELNQKWHFFIAYWGFREYITKYPKDNTDRLRPLKNVNKVRNGNPFRNCYEGKLWYMYVIENER